MRITSGVADDLEMRLVLAQGDLARSIHNATTSFCRSLRGVYTDVRFAFAADSGPRAVPTKRVISGLCRLTTLYLATDKQLSPRVIPRNGTHKIHNCTARTFIRCT